MKTPSKKLPRVVQAWSGLVPWQVAKKMADDAETSAYAQGWADAKADTLEQELRDLSAMARDLTGEK